MLCLIIECIVCIIHYGDIKPLSGRKSEYRLRVGKYRILFFIENENVHVVKIDTRGDIYKQ
ncbi:hypothetical protein ES705_26445 [subsurface metagenome]